MLDLALDAFPFSVIEPPHLRLKKPTWLRLPSAMLVYFLILVSFFLVTGGVIFDIINEPPGIGQTVDERGRARSQAILPWRINGQYIMEGLASSFLFTMCGIGFVILDQIHTTTASSLTRYMWTCVGFLSIVVAYATLQIFIRIKLPSYMS